MQLLILSGFLGAGKTTLLLALARRWADAGRKVAIIENEAGKVGIDDRVLVSHGLAVRELYSGCVCCSLRLDLISTLCTVEKELAPDLVIVEPSGVAGPGAVKDAFAGYAGSLERRLLVVLADGPRARLVAERCAPFFKAAVEVADVVALTKKDATAPEAEAAARAEIARLNPRVPVFAVSAQSGENVGALAAEIDRRLFGAAAVSVGAESAAGGAVRKSVPRPEAAACAGELKLEFAGGIPATTLAAATSDLVRTLAADLRGRGHAILGHIKALLDVPGNGYFIFSITGPETEPQCKGTLGGTIRQAAVRVNAILCGIPEAELEASLRARLDDYHRARREEGAA